MNRNVQFLIGFLFIVIIFTFASAPVLAHHKQEVLGESTTASQLNFPAVTSGPGYILPDSPFFFLDQIKQAFRTSFATDPKQKIKLHKDIAAERLAELRIMIAKNNQTGIDTALSGMTNETSLAAKALTEAAAGGKDVKTEAVSLNDTIKTQRDLLNNLVGQSTGALQLEFKAARKSLQESKVEVEDNLPENELWKEIDETLSSNVWENIDEAGDLAKKLQMDLDRLDDMASKAAARSVAIRTKDLEDATKSKDVEAIVDRKKLLDQEKAKQDKLLTAEKSYLQEARKAIGDEMRAVDSLQNANDIINQIKK